MECKYCSGRLIKKGFQKNGAQKYRCKNCGTYQQGIYSYNSYHPEINDWITALVKEGCGIIGISRLLSISKTTVTRRILKIASTLHPPPIPFHSEFEVDELCTYVGSKSRRRWLTYAIRKDNKQVVSLVVGSRSVRTLGHVVNSLLLANPVKIHTDGLNLYKLLIPETIHSQKRFGTNQIERMNLNLRTHIKRLARRTICYSKSMIMLLACLKIYWWG